MVSRMRVAAITDIHGCAYVTQHDRELGQKSVEWTLAHTDQRPKDFMLRLSFDLRFELGDERVRLVHGSPRKANEYGGSRRSWSGMCAS